MDGVEGSQLGWHWLSGTVEHHSIHLDQLERAGERQNRRPAPGEIDIIELRAHAKTIERPQTLGDDERACDTPADPRPFREGVGLSKCKPKKHGRIDVCGHRWLWRSSIKSRTTSIFSLAGFGSGTR